MQTPVRKLPTVAPVQFVKEVVSELKKVTWPSRQETIQLTAVVIVMSIATAIFIGGLDALLVTITGIAFKR